MVEQEKSGKGSSAGCPGCRNAVVPACPGSPEPWASLTSASAGQGTPVRFCCQKTVL